MKNTQNRCTFQVYSLFRNVITLTITICILARVLVPVLESLRFGQYLYSFRVKNLETFFFKVKTLNLQVNLKGECKQ